MQDVVLWAGNAIRPFFGHPKLAPHLINQLHRTTDDPQTFCGSPAFKQLDQDLDGALANSDILTVLVSLGMDGVQILNWGSRTLTVIGIKCEDLPPHLVQSNLAICPTIVIEGKHEPHMLGDVLKLLVKFFLKHSNVHPSSWRRVCNETRVVETFQHLPLKQHGRDA
jgi:hypothetical protein